MGGVIARLAYARYCSTHRPNAHWFTPPNGSTWTHSVVERNPDSVGSASKRWGARTEAARVRFQGVCPAPGKSRARGVRHGQPATRGIILFGVDNDGYALGISRAAPVNQAHCRWQAVQTRLTPAPDFHPQVFDVRINSSARPCRPRRDSPSCARVARCADTWRKGIGLEARHLHRADDLLLRRQQANLLHERRRI
jgi:hypothetical protein